MVSHVFHFRARWKEELVVTGPGGSFILELPMGVLSAYLPTEDVWATVSPPWAMSLWPTLKAELERWCASNRAVLIIDETATVIALNEHPSDTASQAAPAVAGLVALLGSATLGYVIAARLLRDGERALIGTLLGPACAITALVVSALALQVIGVRRAWAISLWLIAVGSLVLSGAAWFAWR